MRLDARLSRGKHCVKRLIGHIRTLFLKTFSEIGKTLKRIDVVRTECSEV